MQGGNGGRDPFSGFGGPFAGLGGFGSFGSQRSLMSSFFGGRDPFDDPFFSRPFGGMLESNFFGSGGSPFPFMQPPAFLEHQAAEPMTSRGPIIEEINSDGEVAGFEEAWEGNARKHLPGWMANAGSHDTAGVSGLGSQGGRALPSMERSGNMITYDRNIAGSSHSEHLGKTNYNQGSRDNSGNPRGRRKH
ncbi:hypothetical protein HS088_TW15G00368 [Tripterygium wilfordii]|uniref:Glycine-rich protein n=1 Tax=Tripterygium wilfordii TaxID=458696 RepID=A0A7J7CLC8_TRIWF|nr:hypothetical protein HS088_TW15G00368 [Tripterygium wilfordii]